MPVTIESQSGRTRSASSPLKKKPKARDTRESLNMRIRPEVRSLIDHAAHLTGKNRTDFVLDAARQAAQNAVLDQTVLALEPKAHAAFMKLLDAPPDPNPQLVRTMRTTAPWD